MGAKVAKIAEHVRKGKTVKEHLRGGDGPAHRALVEKLAKMAEKRDEDGITTPDGRAKNETEFREWLSQRLNSDAE